jgi:predicted helicase
MSEGLPKFEAIATGNKEERVKALREFLGYPLQELDRTGSGFRYVRAGQDIAQAKNTCPIAVGFYEELDRLSDAEIKGFLTEPAQQQRIYGHYLEQDLENMPVMYLLLPVAMRSGRVAMVLPMEGGLRQRQIETFAWNSADLRSRLVRLNQENLVLTNRFKFADATRDFFSIPSVEWAFYKTAQTAKELAQLLAEVTRRIEQVLPLVYEAGGDDGYLHRLLLSFQRELLPSLEFSAASEKDYSFADIYAQTIAYGLFTARVFSHVRDPLFDFNRRDAWQQLPETNPFLRQLFKDVSEQKPNELGDELVGCIAEVFGILRAAKMDAILSDFREKMNREDIVIRFYEDFLAAYKPKMRERRGVYYTPEPVVSYMVRSVDILIKEKFNKPLGLADPEVMILDPACGTGTFLLWIFKLIYDRFENDGEARSLIRQKLGDITWSDYVRDHLLPRVFGFELLMAPYAICHLKLGLFLEESGYRFDSSQRLGVYLTDSLINALPNKPTIPFEEFIAVEGQAAMQVKQKIPIMIVIGNPPYANYGSMNNGEWIKNLVQDWKPPEEQKWNPDDFMKFIRWAQWRISNTGHGILSFITNHIYLDGITHRLMRKSLVESFGEIHITNLHGSYYKKEVSPNDLSDINIFGIKTGVSVGTFVSNLLQSDNRKLYYSDIWGTVEQKESILSKEDMASISRIEIQDIECKSCLGSLYFFTNKSFANIQEYCKYYSVKEIFNLESKTYGIKTDRDEMFFGFDKQEILDRVKIFYSEDGLKEPFSKKYNIKDSSSYRLLPRRQNTSFDESYAHQCIYRPFDQRWLYYNPKLISRPAWDIMRHMLLENNLGISITRQINGEFGHVFATENMITDCTLSSESKERSYLFPLYIFPNIKDFQSLSQETLIKREKIPNLSQEIINNFWKLGYTPTPEAIFYYIYAIFHSPTYRTRYAEFLKIDFPRVPLTSNDQLFRKLGEYGEELVALHLMKSPKLDQHLTQIIDKGGEFIVDAGHPKYSDGEVIINKKGDRFTGVPKSVWEFYVGGYQVCHKWLKDRKGRQLSPEDLNHYQKIIVALSETMQIMNAIDAAIPSFPIE